MQGQGFGSPIVYQKWQTPIANTGFIVTPSSSILVKVPGLTLILQHASPMLYELHFEGVCRIPDGGTVFRLDFLYNDHTLFQNKVYKNNGVNPNGSGRDWWFSPSASDHHFVCSRSETIYLAPGTYAIDVGAAATRFQAMNLWGGQLTVKMTQFGPNQNMVGSLPMLSVPR